MKGESEKNQTDDQIIFSLNVPKEKHKRRKDISSMLRLVDFDCTTRASNNCTTFKTNHVNFPQFFLALDETLKIFKDSLIVHSCRHSTHSIELNSVDFPWRVVRLNIDYEESKISHEDYKCRNKIDVKFL